MSSRCSAQWSSGSAHRVLVARHATTLGPVTVGRHAVETVLMSSQSRGVWRDEVAQALPRRPAPPLRWLDEMTPGGGYVTSRGLGSLNGIHARSRCLARPRVAATRCKARNVLRIARLTSNLGNGIRPGDGKLNVLGVERRGASACLPCG